MADLQTARDALRRFWGYDGFRPKQEQVIEQVLTGRDCIALLPTGAGKSICFQVPAVVLEGICIVVSPLVALMKDQVERLKEVGVSAEAIYNGMRRADIDRILDNCIYGNTKLLYISPERIQSPLAQERIRRMSVSFIAVDEAHCISQWGFDFRPAYTQIPVLRDMHPHVSILAVTATATAKVVDDIAAQLKLNEPELVSSGFARNNLRLNVVLSDNKHERLVDAVRKAGGTSIVYVRSRRRTKEVARLLNYHNLVCEAYHAGMTHDEREAVQKRWLTGELQTIACTTAFGMGIDKPDVRLVAHYDIPPSLEEYYQEAGRAGRDGKMSECLLVYNAPDRTAVEDNTIRQYPEPEEVLDTYHRLCQYFHLPVDSDEPVTYPFVLRDFCLKFKLQMYTAYRSLDVLQREGWLSVSDSVYRQGRVQLLANREQLSRMDQSDALYQVIAQILRMYEGVLLEPVAINEFRLAERTGLTKGFIRTLLSKGHRDELVHYVPESDEPLMTFTHPRVEYRNVRIDSERIVKLRDHAKDRLDWVFKFLDAQRCREQVLLNYFGESGTKECGRCDLCRSRESTPNESLVLSRIPVEGIALKALLGTFDLAHENVVKAYLSSLESDRLITLEHGIIKRKES